MNHAISVALQSSYVTSHTQHSHWIDLRLYICGWIGCSQSTVKLVTERTRTVRFVLAHINVHSFVSLIFIFFHCCCVLMTSDSEANEKKLIVEHFNYIKYSRIINQFVTCDKLWFFIVTENQKTSTENRKTVNAFLPLLRCYWHCERCACPAFTNN